MNPKVISMFNNVRTFLSDQELAELGNMITDMVGKTKKEVKRKKYNVPTVEDYTAMLMAKQFRPSGTTITKASNLQNSLSPGLSFLAIGVGPGERVNTQNELSIL